MVVTGRPEEEEEAVVEAEGASAVTKEGLEVDGAGHREADEHQSQHDFIK